MTDERKVEVAKMIANLTPEQIEQIRESVSEKEPVTPPLPERWCVQCEYKLDRHEIHEPFTSHTIIGPGGGSRVLFAYWSCKYCKLMYTE